MSPCAHRGHGTSELTQLSSKISQPEVAPCPRHIFEYLRLEGFGGGPGHLGAEAEKEFELEMSWIGDETGGIHRPVLKKLLEEAQRKAKEALENFE